MKVASIQMRVTHGDKRINIKRAETLIKKASEADLIILPELWNIGYFSFDKYFEESESLQGETISKMSEKAKEVKAYVLAGTIIEKQDDYLYNTSVLLNPEGEIVGAYRKMHLFGYGSEEKKLCRPGENAVTVRTELGTFGLTICYDLRFPELYRKLAQTGAEIFLVPSAWPLSPRLEHWVILNRARALENQAFLISCNCVGQAKTGPTYLGYSMAVDPWGVPIACAGFGEEIMRVVIEVEKVHSARKEFPVLKDRVLGMSDKKC